jgi:hypothetical protein
MADAHPPTGQYSRLLSDEAIRDTLARQLAEQAKQTLITDFRRQSRTVVIVMAGLSLLLGVPVRDIFTKWVKGEVKDGIEAIEVTAREQLKNALTDADKAAKDAAGAQLELKGAIRTFKSAATAEYEELKREVEKLRDDDLADIQEDVEDFRDKDIAEMKETIELARKRANAVLRLADEANAEEVSNAIQTIQKLLGKHSGKTASVGEQVFQANSFMKSQHVSRVRLYKAKSAIRIGTPLTKAHGENFFRLLMINTAKDGNGHDVGGHFGIYESIIAVRKRANEDGHVELLSRGNLDVRVVEPKQPTVTMVVSGFHVPQGGAEFIVYLFHLPEPHGELKGNPEYRRIEGEWEFDEK